MLRKFSKKLIIITFACVALVFTFCTVGISYVKGGADYEAVTVVIDPGHGGIDGGVVGKNSKIAERDINLCVAQSLNEYFNGARTQTTMTRTTPQGLYGAPTRGFKVRDLSKRVEIANSQDADAFISIHMNTYVDSSRRGAQVFYGADENSKKLAVAIQNQLNKIDGMKKSEPLCGDYYILNNAKLPSVIVECGFLSNAEDEKLLLTEEYRKKIAYAIFIGTLSYLYKTTDGKLYDKM